MTQDDRPKTGRKSPRPETLTREERLKAALKANMARRKAQARARQGGGVTDRTGADSRSPETE